MNELNEKLSPLARQKQHHRKNEEVHAQDIKPEMTNDAPVPCPKPWKDHSGRVQQCRDTDQDHYHSCKQFAGACVFLSNSHDCEFDPEGDREQPEEPEDAPKRNFKCSRKDV